MTMAAPGPHSELYETSATSPGPAPIASSQKTSAPTPLRTSHSPPSKENYGTPSPSTTLEGDISRHHGVALSPTISVISSSSAESSNPDPLAPLEHALAQTTSITRTRTGRTSIGSAASRPPDFEVIIEPDDPENPKNWPLWYRTYTIIAISYATWIVVLYSTSYTATLTPLMSEFNITSRPIATLGLTSYLFGLAVGSVIVAPLSELYGRRPVYLVCLTAFVLLIIPCGLAQNLATLVGVRFVGATFGAAMVSNSPGTVVDVSKEGRLALAMSLWSIAPLNGPVTGPLIGGFVSDYLGWRWGNWLALILGGVALVMVWGVKETYHPELVKKKTARMRKETGDERYWCRFEDEDQSGSKWEVVREGLKRPFVLAATEPILWFFNIWISIIYGILYLCFVAYPIVFTQYRGWSSSETGLSFLGIGLGTLFSIFLEPLWRRIINSSPKRDPDTGRASPEATALVMSIGAVLTPIGQLAFSWTCLPKSIHPVIPIAFGIFFGMGNTLSFIYGSNYLAGAYGIYAASALAGNAVLRSLAGALLPLAGPAMYKAMTPRWAGTFLGLLEVVLIPIPFMFYKYGDRIRNKSKLIKKMREEQRRNDKRAERRERVLGRMREEREKEEQGEKDEKRGGEDEKV
ncbi:citrinin biosynthesis cluster MFS transporter mrr1 [Cladorrhinum sp. PSN259]|nr:citrinin biosynthesis cluster MFS transporter mrr1 [Cladorrhinum sp. PSN259]